MINKYVGFAFGVAVLVTVLDFFDHNVSAALAQQPEFGLRKGTAYHYDFLLQAFMFVVFACVGLPPTNCVVPQAPLHTRALAVTRRKRGKGKGKRKQGTRSDGDRNTFADAAGRSGTREPNRGLQSSLFGSTTKLVTTSETANASTEMPMEEIVVDSPASSTQAHRAVDRTAIENAASLSEATSGSSFGAEQQPKACVDHPSPRRGE